MRAEMVDTGARSQERAGEKCVYYLTETYMDVGQQALPLTCRIMAGLYADCVPPYNRDPRPHHWKL